jgi:hypothetical protein
MIKVSRPIIGYLLVLLAGCAPSEPVEQTFDFRIERGSVAEQMQVVRVKQGDFVRLRWRTDKPITLHLHGYDIEKKVEPGAITEFAFKAYATGRYPINSHGQSHDESTLVYVEVYPR